jgi:hypothetical protein
MTNQPRPINPKDKHLVSARSGVKSMVNFAKLAIDKQKKKINKDNVIYYFTGFTLVVIFAIYTLPIVFYILTKKKAEVPKISYTQESSALPLNTDRPRNNIGVTSISTVKPGENKNIKVSSKGEMQEIFQQNIASRTTDKLLDYLEKDAQLFVWKPVENNGCCIIENATKEYIVNFLAVVNLDNPVWNFDQKQSDIASVQSIESRFKDNYIGTNSKDTLIGLKVSPNNKIQEINIIVNVKEVYKSVGNYSENNSGGFQKVNLTEEQLRQINEGK